MQKIGQHFDELILIYVKKQFPAAFDTNSCYDINYVCRKKKSRLYDKGPVSKKLVE